MDDEIREVLLPYRFTLFSNRESLNPSNIVVLLPYRFTLFSNTCIHAIKSEWFYYLIDLHYSQTIPQTSAPFILFYYLIDLHYSQTVKV